MSDREVFLQRALLEEGLVSHEQIEAARRYGVEHDVDIVDALVGTEAISSRQLALTKADVCEAPFVDLSEFEPCYSNIALVPRKIAERHCAFPLFMIEGVLTLAIDDPLNLEATDQIRQIAKCEADPVLADREQIRALIAKAYSLGHQAVPGQPEAHERVSAPTA